MLGMVAGSGAGSGRMLVGFPRALAAAAGGEDVAALVTGFGGFHRLPPPPGVYS